MTAGRADLRPLVDPEPVLVDAPRGQRYVRVRPVFRVGNSYAIVDSVPWEVGGEVWESMAARDGQLRKVWRGATTAGVRVVADTRRAVIDRLLEERDEFAVELNDTIPPLF